MRIFYIRSLSAAGFFFEAWMQSGKAFQLFFFEVLTGIQTAAFSPTDYVDISDTQQDKRRSVYCHVSQDPDAIYSEGHADMELSRGREIGVRLPKVLYGRTEGEYADINISL